MHAKFYIYPTAYSVTHAMPSCTNTDNSPTNEERHLEASLSPPSPVQVESLYPQCHKWSMPESSPSPTLPKMPIPLPRKKRLQQTLTQISSPGSSLSTSSTTHHFVFCQETQAPSSLPDTFHIPQPQSVSTSCLTASANYSGDYSGDTGDSGVGDIRHKYIPSQEALDRKFTCSVAVEHKVMWTDTLRMVDVGICLGQPFIAFQMVFMYM